MDETVKENTSPNLKENDQDKREVADSVVKKIIELLKTLDNQECSKSRIRWCTGSLSHLETPSEHVEGSHLMYFNTALVLKSVLELFSSIEKSQLDICRQTVESNGVFPGYKFLLASLCSTQDENNLSLNDKYEEMLHSLIRYGLRKLFNMTKKDWAAYIEDQDLESYICIAPNEYMGSFEHNSDALHFFIELALRFLSNQNIGKKKRSSAFHFLSNLSKKSCMKEKLDKIDESFLYDMFQKFPIFFQSFYSHLTILFEKKLLDESMKITKVRLRRNDLKFPRMACDKEVCTSCNKGVYLYDARACKTCKQYVHNDEECAVEVKGKGGMIHIFCINCFK